MKKLLLLFLLIPIFVNAQINDKELEERINYFKSHPIFVTQLSLNQKQINKLGKKKTEVAQREVNTINKNLRTAFTTFWDLNDTVIFVLDKDLEEKKKEFKENIFFEFIKLGDFNSKDGAVVPVMATMLSISNKSIYFKDIVPRPGRDSSIVSIFTQLRLLKLNVTTGDVMNKKDLGRKIILINKDEHVSKFAESYVDLIRSKYKGSFIEVDNKFLVDVILSKNPSYIYVRNGSTYNAEDGTMIPLH